MLAIQLSPQLHSVVKMMKNVELRKVETPFNEMTSSLSKAEAHSIFTTFNGSVSDRAQKVSIRSTWG